MRIAWRSARGHPFLTRPPETRRRRHRAYSGHDRRPLPDPLARGAVPGSRPAGHPHRRRALGPERARGRPRGIRGRAHPGCDLPRPRYGPRRARGPGRHPLPSPAAFRERLEAAGIGSDDTVVAYDDTGGATAARLWWMLDDLGHERVAILDGGYPAWVAAGYPVSTTEPEPRPRGNLELRDAWTRVTDRDAVAAGLGTFVLLDARARPAYRGEVEPVDRVPGHIPTARQRALGELPRAGWAIARRRGPRGRGSATLGVDESNAASVVTSCGSGVTASLTSLAMRIAGLPDPILYPGSYSDWIQRRPADRHRRRAGEPPSPPTRPKGAPPDQPSRGGRTSARASPGRRPVGQPVGSTGAMRPVAGGLCGHRPMSRCWRAPKQRARPSEVMWTADDPRAHDHISIVGHEPAQRMKGTSRGLHQAGR